jgi:hypothetical protein
MEEYEFIWGEYNCATVVLPLEASFRVVMFISGKAIDKSSEFGCKITTKLLHSMDSSIISSQISCLL